MSLFTKYLEGHKEVIKSIDDSKRSPFQKGIGKLFVNLKVLSPQKIDDKKNAIGCNDL